MNHELEWPDIAVCMEPFFKDKELFENFSVKAKSRLFKNSEEFQAEVDQVFFKSEEIIQAVLFGKSYPDAFSIKNIKSYEIKPPLIKTVQADYKRIGACAVISLMSAKQIMIKRGYEAFSKEKDSSFITIIYLKVFLINILKYNLQKISSKN